MCVCVCACVLNQVSRSIDIAKVTGCFCSNDFSEKRNFLLDIIIVDVALRFERPLPQFPRSLRVVDMSADVAI